jgi:hypothetical protein
MNGGLLTSGIQNKNAWMSIASLEFGAKKEMQS